VRGAFIIAGYTAVLGGHFFATVYFPESSFQQMCAVIGVPLSVLTAIYTAYLFAQATARDLWQSPLLPPHLLVQAFLVGSAILFPFTLWLEPHTVPALAWLLGATSALHLFMVCGEVTLAHPTAHAHLASREMTSGAFRSYFWLGVALVVVGLTTPWVGVTAALCALVGVLSHEHAYVQAGQAVPLA
jgi:Ni/Fe-hydrogenase subunit HybB-like protein